MIIEITDENVSVAGKIHSISWRDSHKDICTKAFIELHSEERQTEYLLNKLKNGTKIFMLIDALPVGIISLTSSLIEDLYVLPEYQNKGYGSKLLEYAITKCSNPPTLWILENNKKAQRLYEKRGFRLSGKKNKITDILDEIEMILEI